MRSPSTASVSLCLRVGVGALIVIHVVSLIFMMNYLECANDHVTSADTTIFVGRSATTSKSTSSSSFHPVRRLSIIQPRLESNETHDRTFDRTVRSNLVDLSASTEPPRSSPPASSSPRASSSPTSSSPTPSSKTNQRVWSTSEYSAPIWTSSDRPQCESLTANHINCTFFASNSDVPQTCEVDAVYTWVNPDDPGWRQELRSLGINYPENRFRDWGELRYSMRSVLQHAYWVRRVYLVLASPTQVPSWLDPTHPRMRIVYHRELFAAAAEATGNLTAAQSDDVGGTLPTFNSLAIESVLHHIRGLSNHFLYMNNDVFFGHSAPLSTFVTDRTYKRYLDWMLANSIEYSFSPFNNNVNCGMPANEMSLEVRRKCVTRFPFLWDSYLARRHFNVASFGFWFAHMPHLWQRCALYEVEKRLSEYLSISRRNRLRDSATDISIHMQYESYLRSVAPTVISFYQTSNAQVEAMNMANWQGPGPQPRQIQEVRTAQLNGLDRDRPTFYLYKVFANNDFKSPDPSVFSVVAPKPNEWYTKLEVALDKQPTLIAIDDDLLDPTMEFVKSHRERLRQIFEKQWPQAAPWEKDQPTYSSTS